MIYRLDNETGIISVVSFEQARKALLPRWREDSIVEMARTKTVLWNDAAHYGAVEFYLKEKRDQLRCTGASEGAASK